MGEEVVYWGIAESGIVTGYPCLATGGGNSPLH
jgi:hypothetical protein